MIKLALYAAGLSAFSHLAWSELGARSPLQLAITMFFSMLAGALVWRLVKGDY